VTTYRCAVQAFEFDFVKRQPAAPLSRLVESLWFARGTVPYHREKIAPTGSTVAVFVLGDAGRPCRRTRSNLVGGS